MPASIRSTPTSSSFSAIAILSAMLNTTPGRLFAVAQSRIVNAYVLAVVRNVARTSGTKL